MRAWTSSSPAAQSCTSATRPSQRIRKRCYQPLPDPGSDTPSSAVAVLEDVALVRAKSSGADESDGESSQRGDGGSGAVVAQGQAFVGQQPADGALDHPAMPAESGAGVVADAGDAGGDPAAAQVAAHPRDVVALVGVQLDRAAAGMAAAAPVDGRHRVQDR